MLVSLTDSKMATSNPLVSAFVIILIILPQMAALLISPPPGATGDIESETDNTARADPLNNLKRYRGGFNVTNKHYWSSVIFTGACGYAIGLLCLVCGLVYASFLGTAKFCCKTHARRKMKSRYACNDMWLMLIAILFTILAVAATGIVLGGSAKFYSEARASVNILIRTANEASQTLHNTTGALKDIESKLEGSSVGVGVEASDILTSTSHKLDAESALIEMQASKNRHRIHRGLKIVFIITTVTISFNSVAAASLAVCGVLRLRRALYFLIVLCWLMTVMCWLLFGVYLFLDRFSNDACRALARFEENPYNNSLSSILPCDQLLSAKTVLSRVSAGIYNLVNEVNANISVVHVCNPFSAPPQYSYQPHNCPANTVRIADVPKVLSMYMCPDDSEGMCNERVEACTSSIQDLLDVYPRMQNLVECQSLRQAFSYILLQHCKPLQKFARITWLALVLLAVLMVFLLLLCAINSLFPSQTATATATFAASASTRSP